MLVSKFFVNAITKDYYTKALFILVAYTQFTMYQFWRNSVVLDWLHRFIENKNYKNLLIGVSFIQNKILL